ncbi:uncharacterized protein LOC108206299 isoform X2 [Daucus carota subsp. sativus]|uniref:3'-5' exonuclease domain-containing protein n=1 Tax=Daucus carota subsp. sativus TaxID=79200 RepID=A0A166D0L8_DAUCS|nr:PREDICTED: uncharacterized protein LOC108206299 isoform X2 [Daucus carota subsp. sativus]
MALDGNIQEHNSDAAHQLLTMCTHSYFDLTHVSPVVFLYLLKECYVRGKCKATMKFRSLQQTVHQVLYNAPRPGPAIFVARCLLVLPIFESHCEGFSHLLISALRRFLINGTTKEDMLEAKFLASKLFLNTVGGIGHDERILIKILEVFDVKLEDIGKVICNPDVKDENNLNAAKEFIKQYILNLVESKSYMTAVTLLEHFGFCQFGEAFLLKMMEHKEYTAAEKWAAFMGKPMLCVLVQEYLDRSMLKNAYNVIRNNSLKDEFPEAYHKGKESSIKKFAEKGLWDIAEERTNKNKQHLEYLVYLAMEAGYFEKAEELRERHALEGFANLDELQASLPKTRFFDLNELALDGIKWVDDVSGLRDATCHIEGCKVIGIDCEWKPVYEKGKKPKVSIIQIASEKMVHILDLIKLFEDVPEVLDNCLTRIFRSSKVLKLGYNFQCDAKQLARSYESLECFKHYEMLLDIQNLFNEPRGGLSGLTKKILGAELNKTRRNSDWEQRPLTPNQLEYAALDAVVLIHIFAHFRGQSPQGWKAHIGLVKVRPVDEPVKQMESA